MSSEFSTIISSITLLVSIVSPVVVTAINNHHSIKTWKLQEKERRIRASVENYVRNAGAAISSPAHYFDAYRSAYGEIFLCVESSLWESIAALDEMLFRLYENGPSPVIESAASSTFKEICQALSSESSNKKNRKHRRNTK